MEGSAIAVAAAFTLPAVPGTGGTVAYVPLGGDGFRAPFAAYGIKTFAAVGDATGGSVVMTCTFDNRYCTLVSFATVQITQGTAADAGARLIIRGNTIPTTMFQDVITSVIDDVSAFQVAKEYAFSPLIVPGGGENGQLQASFDNVDGDLYFVDSMMYLFNIRVRELTPMGPLLWARGAT